MVYELWNLFEPDLTPSRLWSAALPILDSTLLLPRPAQCKRHKFVRLLFFFSFPTFFYKNEITRWIQYLSLYFYGFFIVWCCHTVKLGLWVRCMHFNRLFHLFMRIEPKWKLKFNLFFVNLLTWSFFVCVWFTSVFFLEPPTQIQCRCFHGWKRRHQIQLKHGISDEIELRFLSIK